MNHTLLWIEGAPVYGAENNSQIEQFVDKYITCNIDHLDPELAKFHRHYHTKSCRKQKNSHCRYNFPVPPMRTTRIIEPISLEDNVVIEKSKSLFTFLEQRDFDELMSFDDFLAELNLIEDEYIQAMQCTLKQPKNFLKRKLSHIWNNNFSKDMPVMWNANTNAQYVLNAYVVASYCTSYMTKVDKSMTSAFRRI